MAQARCSRGHIFDTDIYGRACPYCESGAGRSIDFGANNFAGGVFGAADDMGKTVPINNPIMPEKVNKTAPPEAYAPAGQQKMNKTVGVFEKKTGMDPVVGWLVCINGHDKGHDYRLCAKTNTIGRGEDMDIRIKGDDTISSNIHAKIDYDILNNSFYLIPGNNKNTIYVNNAPLYSAQKLKAYDRLRFGQSELMFVPFCCEYFVWPARNK